MAVPGGGAESMARDGKTRILAVIAPERLALLPQVPTVREQNIEQEIGLWQALYVPARTPQPIIAQLNTAVHEAMQAPAFLEVLRSQAAKPEPTSPEGLAALETRERAAWGGIVQQLGIRIE
jgi:tripartite-type tricarboxylate transporter receptor subunit TctC